MTQIKALLVHATCPDENMARDIAAALVEKRLAACVNIVPGAVSIYRWNNQVEQARECLLLIKTTSARLDEVQEAILEQHPDEVPEIIATNIVQGLPAYMAWLEQETQP